MLTAAVLILLGFFLTIYHLQWNPDKPWPPQPEPYIELDAGEEFIEPEIVPPPASADPEDAAALTPEDMDVPAQAAPESGVSMRNQGEQAPQPPKEVTTKRPAPVQKQESKPQDKTGAQAKNDEEAKREAQAKATQNNVKNAFAKPNAANNANNRNGDTGKAGSTNGRTDSAGPADSKSTSTGVQHGNVSGGWQWPRYSVRITTPHTGSVILRLTIDRTGSVTKAVLQGGKAPASANQNLVSQCIAIAKSKKFTRSDNSEPPATATATLTFTFK